MIQRCPNCGQWCEVEKDSTFVRYCKGANDAGEIGANILGNVGRLFGKTGEKIGRNLGYFGGSAIGGNVAGLGEALYGDSYNFICPSCGHEWSCDSEAEDQTEEYNHIQEIISLKDQLLDNDPSDSASIQELIDEIKEYIQSETDDALLSTLLDIRSVAYWQLDELGNAYKDINQSIDIVDDSHSRALRGLYLLEIHQSESNPSPKSIVKAISDLTSIFEEEHVERLISISRLNSALESGITDYVNNFAALSPSERRFICFTDKIQAMGNHILVLPVGQLPQGITFQEGLPRKNVIYEVHPFKPNHYISLDNFEFDMFNDKMGEFQWIMENLGARQINIIVESNQEQTISQTNRRNVQAEGEYSDFNANGKYTEDQNTEKFEKLHLSIEQHSKFLPGNEVPHLPSDLTWYPHLVDWQKKVNSRLAGRVNSFDIRFESKTDQSLSESEAKQLEAEMKYIVARAKGNIETTFDYHISKSENHIWRAQVDFYPLDCFAKKETNLPESTSETSYNQLTAGEQEYMDTFKEIIQDGKITEKERKLLDTIGSKAGLSVERIAELEASIIPPKKKSWWEKIFN